MTRKEIENRTDIIHHNWLCKTGWKKGNAYFLKRKVISFPIFATRIILNKQTKRIIHNLIPLALESDACQGLEFQFAHGWMPHQISSLLLLAHRLLGNLC